MADIVKLDKNQIISSFIQLPLWFIVSENYFYIWNGETQSLQSYNYHDINVWGKKNSSTDSLLNPINEIELLLPQSQKYTINLNVNHEEEFNEFFLSLLGQLATNAK